MILAEFDGEVGTIGYVIELRAGEMFLKGSREF
jgi:hypothetical protein